MPCIVLWAEQQVSWIAQGADPSGLQLQLQYVTDATMPPYIYCTWRPAPEPKACLFAGLYHCRGLGAHWLGGYLAGPFPSRLRTACNQWGSAAFVIQRPHVKITRCHLSTQADMHLEHNSVAYMTTFASHAHAYTRSSYPCLWIHSKAGVQRHTQGQQVHVPWG